MDVSVVGLGKMGSALARRLLDQGLAVRVWNRHPEAAGPLVQAGATSLSRPGDAWQGSRTAISFLANDEAVKEVCLSPQGLVATAPLGAVLIEMSTISPVTSQEVAAAAEGRGLHYVRCPVSGNPGVLAAGNLTLIASGPPASLELAMPVLSRVGAQVHRVGEAEEARVVKLAINAMLAANAAAMAEVITLCEASGTSRSVLLEVLGSSAVGSPFVKYKTPALLARHYDATFTTQMAVKDLRLAQDLGASHSVPLPVTDLVTRLAVATCEEGWGDADFMAFLPYIQKLAGREPDVAPSPSSQVAR